MALRNWQKENISPKQLITIRQRGGGVNDASTSPDAQQIWEVAAPLPDGFGMTVGSEFGTPFDTGGVNDTLAKLFAIGGISQKAGIRMQKVYMNPEPTEISFDMEFYAWYDPKSEVVVPAVTLMGMALGRVLTYEELNRKIKGFYTKMANLANTGASAAGFDLGADTETEGVATDAEIEKGASRLMELIGIIQGPPSAEIRFGDFMVLPKCYITSVATSFSNVLDPDGVPMSCKCSVTATLEQAPVADDVYQFFDIVENQ